jgi:Fic family protein
MSSRLTPFFPDHQDIKVMVEKSRLIFDSDKLFMSLVLPEQVNSQRQMARIMSVISSSQMEGECVTPVDLQQIDHGSADVMRARRLLSAYARFSIESASLYSASSILAVYANWCAGDEGNAHNLMGGSPAGFRSIQVSVGRHIAPPSSSIPGMLDKMAESQKWLRSDEHRLISLFALNHRFLWVHPFEDGNGRISRLLMDCGMQALGISGLWSLSHRLQMLQEKYYLSLAQADQPRRGDMDGRGNLSRSGLVSYLDFMLDSCLEEISCEKARWSESSSVDLYRMRID